MNISKGDTIEFEWPATDCFGTGKVEGFFTKDGEELIEIIDHQDNEYPVHPNNVVEVVPNNE